MSTTLSRTGYVLPAGPETCDVAVLNGNMQKVDAQIGYTICTSATRPSTPYLGQPIYETDFGLRRYWNGTTWVTFNRELQVATSTTRPSGPVSGQQIFETDTRMLAYYDGSNWIQYAGVSDGSTVHEAEYYAATVQSVPSGADTPLNFDTIGNATTADVTRGTATGGGIANGKYTLNRGGLWHVDVGMRMQASDGPSFGVWLGLDNSSSFRFAENFCNSGGAANIGVNLSITRRFGPGTALNAYAWQNSGATKNTDTFAQAVHIRLAWLRP